MSEIQAATDELVANCEADALHPVPMAWASGTVLQLIARIRQEQARADRLAPLVSMSVETWADRATKDEAEVQRYRDQDSEECVTCDLHCTVVRDALRAENERLRGDVETLRSGLRTFPVGSEHAARDRIARLLAHTEPPAPAEVPHV